MIASRLIPSSHAHLTAPISVLVILGLVMSACQPAIRPLPKTRHSETHWVVQSSLPLDALAFLNALTGDPLVVNHYSGELASFKSKFTPAEEQAASRLDDFRATILGGHLSGTHFVTIPEDTGAIRSTIHELLHNPFNNTDPAFVIRMANHAD